MKIKNKQIKDCENPDWTKTIVLDLEYTHKWKVWRILVKDYDDKFYEVILKQLRKEIKKYFLMLEKWQ